VNPERLDIIATGAGTCGTGYVSHVLTSGGIICGHEHFFGPNGLRDPDMPGKIWPDHPRHTARAESSWYAAQHLDHPLISDARLIHVVRNPLHTIRSRVSRYWTELPPPSEILKQIYWHIGWTLQIEKAGKSRDYFRYRIEDGPEPLLAHVGIEQMPSWDDRRYNAHWKGHFDLTWDDVPKGDHKKYLLSLCGRYGYE